MTEPAGTRRMRTVLRLLMTAVLGAGMTVFELAGVAGAVPHTCRLDQPVRGQVTLGQTHSSASVGGVLHDVTLPSVHGATATAATAIDAALLAGAQAFMSSVTNPQAGVTLTVSCLSASSNGRYLSVVQIYTYDAGPSGAHPYDYLHGYVFDEASGSLLPSEQLFRSHISWPHVLAGDTYSEVARNCPSAASDVTRLISSMVALFSSPDPFSKPAVTLGADGLHVDYQPGTIGPEACGVVSTVVSYRALQGALDASATSPPAPTTSHPAEACLPVGPPRVVVVMVMGLNSELPAPGGGFAGSYRPMQENQCDLATGSSNPTLTKLGETFDNKTGPGSGSGATLLTAIAHTGALILPFSYRGACFLNSAKSGCAEARADGTASPPLFQVTAYTSHVPNEAEIIQEDWILDAELVSIRREWPAAKIIIIGHSEGGLMGLLRWAMVRGDGH